MDSAKLKINIFFILLIYMFFSNIAFAQITFNSPDLKQSQLNEPFDISGDFRNFSNTYFIADSLV